MRVIQENGDKVCMGVDGSVHLLSSRLLCDYYTISPVRARNEGNSSTASSLGRALLQLNSRSSRKQLD